MCALIYKRNSIKQVSDEMIKNYKYFKNLKQSNAFKRFLKRFCVDLQKN